MYARKLTKEELMKCGITAVTEDGHVFRGEEELIPKVNNKGYFTHFIYDFDADGNKIRIPNPKSAFGYNYKMRSVGLHRVMWAWFNEEVPNGMIVDHISNKHTELKDYELTNLQLLSPRDNILKERTYSTRELPCPLYKPRSYYEDSLANFKVLYEQAKKDRDQKAAHRLRTQMSQYSAKLRYWDSHIEEYRKNSAEFITDTEISAAKAEAKSKKELKAEHIKVLRTLAAEAKTNGDYNRWHNILRVINNYDAFPQDKIIHIVEKEDAKRKALAEQ